jgi:hypothetical protein
MLTTCVEKGLGFKSCSTVLVHLPLSICDLIHKLLGLSPPLPNQEVVVILLKYEKSGCKTYVCSSPVASFACHLQLYSMSSKPSCENCLATKLDWTLFEGN